MAEYGYVVGWLKVLEVGCGWDGKQLRVVGWESRWDGIMQTYHQLAIDGLI